MICRKNAFSLKCNTPFNFYDHFSKLYRVKEINGLRVADASIIPNVTSGNTNAPCIMIGEKASDIIKGKDTVKQFREQIEHLNL